VKFTQTAFQQFLLFSRVFRECQKETPTLHLFTGPIPFLTPTEVKSSFRIPPGANTPKNGHSSVNRLVERFRSAVDQVLGFLESETGDDLADDLDNGDLVTACGRQDHIERVLLFS